MPDIIPLQSSSMFSALVFNPESNAWRRYTNPVEVLIADAVVDVEPLLSRVEDASHNGLTAVGFVCYEASPAFDPALVHIDRSQGKQNLPLAAFALYSNSEPFELPETTVELELSPKLEFEAFDQAINRIHTYQANGDTYQVNFTHQWQGTLEADALDVFAGLWRKQPTDRAYYLETDEYAICCLSPELFFTRKGDQIECEPMKGTRARGRLTAEDQSLYDELKSSSKDRAENLMIVDMIRNDLGRVAKSGSVAPESMFAVKGYPTVWQQVSTVRAVSDASLVGLFKALFPCASVTGAPKCRTMEIIRELETEPRGVYTGAIGVVEPGGDARFSVAIRTLVVDKLQHQATYGVGGGIVWNSNSEDEWHECQTKASLLNRRLPPFRLLETLKLENDSVFLEAFHLDRLEASADRLGFACDRIDIVSQLNQFVSKAEGASLRVRMLLDRDGKLAIEGVPLPDAQPVKLRLANTPVQSSNLFLFHKTTHREVYDSARSAVADCDDVILYNEHQELTETTICNLFLKIDGQLLTPALDAGLLAGTFRRYLIEKGEASEARLTVDDLKRADAIFVGNSVRGLQEAIYCE